MRKNKNLLLLTSLALLSILTVTVGCSNGKNTSQEVSSQISSEVKQEVSVSSVKDAITKLANSKNYTVKVKTETGPMVVENNKFYTENAFYDDFLGDEYGYCKVSEGVFRFDRYARRFTPSSILKDNKGNSYDGIWGKGLFFGFNDLDLQEFNSAKDKTFTCTKKKNKLVFMQMFGIDQTKYTEVSSIKMTVGDKIDSFEFKVGLEGGDKYICTISDFEETSIDYLNNEFENGSTYFTADATLGKVIDLFKGNNYTHFMYDESFDKVNPVGYEKFTNEYFISGYTNAYVKYNSAAVVKCSGMIGFDDYKVNDRVTLDGAYYAYSIGDSFSLVTSFAYNEDSYVPNVYTYPTFLKAFSNPQYFESAGVEGSYFTEKLSVVKDFCDNFQLWDGLNENNFTPCGLYVNYDKSFNGKDTVTFKIQYDSYGNKGTTDFVFSDFGTTEERIMEHKYAEKYVQAFYNGIKAYVQIDESEIKRLSIKTNKNWILDDSILESYEFDYFKNVTAGQEVKISVLNVDKLDPLSVSLDAESNENAEIREGKIVIKKDGNYKISLTKYANGSIVAGIYNY